MTRTPETRIQPPGLLGLMLVALIGSIGLSTSVVSAQEDQRPRRFFDEAPQEPRQRESTQPPRQRGRAADEQDRAHQREGRAMDRPDSRVVPPRPGWDGRWILGVTTQTTSAGVRVRSVLPGTPAARAGLERDDIIVTVDGFQVGRVGPRNYPLGEELQFRAGRRGDVLLLVQDRRNDQLVNLPVHLTQRPAFDEWPRRRERGPGDFPDPRQQSEPDPRRQSEDPERRADDDRPIE